MTKKDAIIYLISKAVSQDPNAIKNGFTPEGMTITITEEDNDYGSIGEHFKVTYIDAFKDPQTALVRVDAVKSLMTPQVILSPRYF